MKEANTHSEVQVTVDTAVYPTLQNETNVILKVTATVCCGSDSHNNLGGLAKPRSTFPRLEFIGIIEEAGGAVNNLKVGDRVVIPFPIACEEITKPQRYRCKGRLRSGTPGTFKWLIAKMILVVKNLIKNK